MSLARRLTVAALALVAVCALGVGGLLWNVGRPGTPLTPEPLVNPPATGDELASAASHRIFFGHRSVGANVVSGIPAVYNKAGIQAPQVVELAQGASLPAGTSGVLAHARLGENGKPLLKLTDFDTRLRSGLASQVDVAVMKLCYLDITGTTDVDAVFGRYRDTLAALQRDYPDITFLHVTTPVKTEPADLKWRVKEVLGRPNDNAARERYNALMRAEYGDAGLLDLAAVEASGDQGGLVTATHQGKQHLALAPHLARDSGHLNDAGSALAADRFMGLIGRTGEGR